ncbi:FxsA family protein [Pistricoccus aurantiacus]|uniref:FxsA family protein n=1 Tax=Pistricoccus aurantiacus TaxID=1883414 RepID=A0A5B8SRJ9_9GAMM|nr:FxsA family protein [Pistricoccus aurantiacus]QEA39742.1 FxsA family protein [Pistricoccus aurantiacus]
MPLLLFFTLFALLDFVILFTVGSKIGLLTTLILVLATGFIGLHLVRREGVATFMRAQQRLAQGEIPSNELMTGAALIFGGALLMAPGFLSDALGIACLLPKARKTLGRLLAKLSYNVKVKGFSQRYQPSNDWEQAGRKGRASENPEETNKPRGQEGKPLEGDFIAKDEPRR